MRVSRQNRHIAFSFVCALTACMQSPATSTTTTTSAAVAPHPHAAHELLVDTAACFMGGIWGDVQGETPDERERSSKARCELVIRDVFGKPNHKRYLQLRAFDPETLDLVKLAMDRRALRDPAESRNVDALDKIFTRFVFASQETTAARRAAHRILRDWDHERALLNDDETRALPELEHTIAFDELWRADAGELRAEAKVLALMVLLDRLRVAESLPLHLKAYVVAEPLHVVFGATPPNLPHDASKPLERGAWLAFLVDAANQARHPVSDDERRPQERHEQALAGILEGIADQLEQNASAIGNDTPLTEITRRTIRVLGDSRQRVNP